MMVGVAPGGAVAVWVTGKETREVFFGQAEPYEAEIKNPLGGEIDDRAQYARSYLEDLPPEVLADIDKNGVPFGLWAMYRKVYRWNPVFSKAHLPKVLSISLFNGENYRLDYPLEASVKNEARPLPLLMSFHYPIDGAAKDYLYIVRFDDKEMFSAFDQLSKNQELVNIEFDPRLPKSQTKVRLYNSKESIELKKFTVDEW